MRRRLLTIIILFPFLSNLVLSFNIPIAKSELNTITVPDDFPTIQEAIDNAQEGFTVYVRNGTYRELLSINKSIELVGESNVGTIINGTTRTLPIVIMVTSAINVTIRQLAVATTPWDYGTCIGVLFSHHVRIEDNQMFTNGDGVDMEYSDENMILRNIMVSSARIVLLHANFNVILGNTWLNYGGEGVEIGESNNNLVCSNTFMSTSHYAVGVIVGGSRLGALSHDNIITKNTILGPYTGVFLSYSDGTKVWHNNIQGGGDLPDAIVQNSDETSWDSGYPTGGNHWANYNGTDNYGGPYQNETGSDGIGDTPYVFDAENADHYPLMQTYDGGTPDIGLLFQVTKQIVSEQYNREVVVEVNVVNSGQEPELFNIICKMNLTIQQQAVHLSEMNATTIVFSWNLTQIPLGRYVISAEGILANDTDLTDNYQSASIRVVIPGDVSSRQIGIADGIVNMRDISYIVLQFYTDPYRAKWNPNVDVNNDGTINMTDISIAVFNFNKHE